MGTTSPQVLAALCGPLRSLRLCGCRSSGPSFAPRSFVVEGEVFRWRDRTASAAEVARAREIFVAFGSCSFDEPVEDLRALGLLAA